MVPRLGSARWHPERCRRCELHSGVCLVFLVLGVAQGERRKVEFWASIVREVLYDCSRSFNWL